GNIRLSYGDIDGDGIIDIAEDTNNDGVFDTDIDGDGDLDSEIIEENNYYPFGLKHKGYNDVIQGDHHPYGYNGMEESNDPFDLNTLDFGARNYDPAIGRWMNIDPLAEQMRRHSPFNYAFNSPTRFIDPDGMSPDDVIIRRSEGMSDEEYEKFKTDALADLNKLTSQTLGVDESGKVFVSNSDCEGECDEVTNAVNFLVEGTDSIVQVKYTSSEGNSTTTTGAGDLNSDGTPNPADVVDINYNPQGKKGGKDVNNNRERPAYVGFGHEIGHAVNLVNGVADKSSTGEIDPDFVDDPDPQQRIRGSRLPYTKEEKNARIFENLIRAKNGIPLRRLE
ncbi:RHS repeat-associated core domain-containing protein, partial [Pontimicrobium sp. MEBiC01747]